VIEYEEFICRNNGYIAPEIQKKIRETTVLIAGCGIGSTVAEAMLRAGFVNLILVDGDTVAGHNLNRQDYTAADIGHSKVAQLSHRLQAIFPPANIQPLHQWITPQNAADFVSQADLVFDTVDFLSMESITALHDGCRKLGKPAISAVSAGWGGAALYFPPAGKTTFRDVFGLPAQGSVRDFSYVKQFASVIEKLGDHLGADIRNAMAKALTYMADGTPCPAPHISVGAFCVAALGTTIAIQILSGAPVAAAPQMILANLAEISTKPRFSVI
jgi:molybdopterin/thiamine biosynthesis adenylyltransferase